MWSPLSWILERIGAFNLRLPYFGQRLQIGEPDQPDYAGGRAWMSLRQGRRLSEAWGPRPEGPWHPFHCITLFAALDYLDARHMGPAAHDPLPVAKLRMPAWLDAGTALFVDLPGPKSVALGAALATQGCELVCTFNNWPHAKALQSLEPLIACLLRYAAWLQEARLRPAGAAPVAWLCDNARLEGAPGRPGQFDNRYFLEDTQMPGSAYLRRHGIRRIVHLGAVGEPVRGDLAQYLQEYQREGLEISRSELLPEGGLAEPSALTLPAGGFTRDFRPNPGGGFGTMVPQPSSGGG